MTRHVLTAVLCAAALLAPLTLAAQEVAHREHTQQQRIAQGVHSGQLTHRETHQLETRERRINASRKADLAAHDGHLTKAESTNLNDRENSLSHTIARDKHNDLTQPGVRPQ